MSDLYLDTSRSIAKLLTNQYSTSFSASSRLFSPARRVHIYAIYGLVRIADEIVDTYVGDDSGELLDELMADTLRALESGYSTNPIVHAYAATARQFGIDATLITPFFDSMRMDLEPQVYDIDSYQTYIYGSAEVVGLMCLRVFVSGDQHMYEQLRESAASLGSAYQKVNFLRDIADDVSRLGRWYFPSSSLATFDESTKNAIVADIRADIACAQVGLPDLPTDARRAVGASLALYGRLLGQLDASSVETLKSRRVRLSSFEKVRVVLPSLLRGNR